MPSMCDDDDIPFDRTRAACRGVGLVADTFWRMPGVLRSDNPHAFAAIGPQAARITQPHPVDIPHGVDSPPGRVHELDGQVLLLGVGHDADTTIHVAEQLAGVRYRLPKYATVMEDGRPKRYEYGETDHCCEGFALLDEWLGQRQRRGYRRPRRSAPRALARHRHRRARAPARRRDRVSASRRRAVRGVQRGASEPLSVSKCSLQGLSILERHRHMLMGDPPLAVHLLETQRHTDLVVDLLSGRPLALDTTQVVTECDVIPHRDTQVTYLIVNRPLH